MMQNHSTPMSMDFSEFITLIDKFTTEEKQILAQKLLGNQSGLTVILGGNNVVNNCFSHVIQLNGGSEEIAKQIEQLPQEDFQKLVRAIAFTISDNNHC